MKNKNLACKCTFQSQCFGFLLAFIEHTFDNK